MRGRGRASVRARVRVGVGVGVRVSVQVRRGVGHLAPVEQADDDRERSAPEHQA